MSNPPKVERKLAAIMFTDIAGFTESMSYDEQQAMNAVKKKRSIIQPLIKEHNGVFVKEIGDGTLSYFSSAIDASTCAVKLQELTYDEEHLNIRVGLHIGDIVFDGQDVFGEGVNIASRLESLSPVGGVCVSKTVYDELENKKEFNGTSLGLQSLKGVGRLVEVYALKGDKLKEPDTSKYKETEVEKHTDDEVPAIAIIPFKNKGAEEDVFYAYGISADLISDCSGAGLIRVSSMEEIEELGDIPFKEKAKKLNVRYVSNGTLWKMGEMFQLSIELYDTKESKVVWSDRWQEKWENLSTIKSNLSDGLLKALDTSPKQEMKLESINPDAYEYYLKAKHKYAKRENIEDIEIVRELLKKAIELDENISLAKLLLVDSYIIVSEYDIAMQILSGIRKDAKNLNNNDLLEDTISYMANIFRRKGEYEIASNYYDEALEIYKKRNDNLNISKTLTSKGIFYSNNGQNEKALNCYHQSIEINNEIGNDNISTQLNNIGCIYESDGDFIKSLEYFEKAYEIAKKYNYMSLIGFYLLNIGFTHIYLCNYIKGLRILKKSHKILSDLDDKFCMTFTLFGIGMAYYKSGKTDEGLKYSLKSKKLAEQISDKEGLMESSLKIGIIYFSMGNFKQSLKYFEESLRLQKDLDAKGLLSTTIILINLTLKKLNRTYDIKSVKEIINKVKYIEFEFEYRIFQLIEDKSYLETAYNQLQEKADAMDDELKDKFINYPIPKQIIEEFNKVFNPPS